jgi:hypothetical protein
MTPATSLADTTSVVPGALMCPEARMKQHAFRRQLSRRVSLAHRDEPVPAESLQQQQQCHMQALMKCRKARQAAMAVAQQHAGLRQLSQARLMRPGSFMGVRAPSASPCTSVEEARARCLGELGDFVLAQHMQELQQLPVAGSFQLSAMPAPGVRLGHGATLGAAASLQPAAAALRAPGMSFCSLGKAGTLATEPGTVLQADDSVVARPSTAGSKAAAAAVRDSAEHEAAAAVKSRKLPPVLRQLQLVVKRSFWKAMLARSGFMTDLLLTSVLGMALGVAQGRNNEPSMSLLWMLITLLAYGCMTLVRSTRCYGHERHLYLQQESPVSEMHAWGLGGQDALRVLRPTRVTREAVLATLHNSSTCTMLPAVVPPNLRPACRSLPGCWGTSCTSCWASSCIPSRSLPGFTSSPSRRCRPGATTAPCWSWASTPRGSATW